MQSPLAQPPLSEFQMSQDKCWLRNKETPLLPTSCETASILAFFPCSLHSWRIYLRMVGRGLGGGRKRKKNALASSEKEDRNSEHSSCWKFIASNDAICRPHLWLSHAILQLAPSLPGTTPSFFSLKARKMVL